MGAYSGDALWQKMGGSLQTKMGLECGRVSSGTVATTTYPLDQRDFGGGASGDQIFPSSSTKS